MAADLNAPVAGRSAQRRRGFVARIGVWLTAGFVLLAVFADVIAPTDPFDFVGQPFEPPSLGHWFGTDDLGRDVFSGVVHGARTSLIVGVTVAAASLVIGTIVGGVSGFFGGWVDMVLMRFTELVQVMPRFFLALTVVALFGPSLTNLVLVLALTSWELTARVVRSGVLSVRERGYVTAATALGASRLRNLVSHVVPNSFAPAVALASLQVGGAILIEAGLSFLGLGDPGATSWGYMLNNAQSFVRRAWWMSLFPGVAVALAVLGVNLLGDFVTETLDPRLRKHARASST
jgi:peptide/nickel transport system permease protein